MSLLFYKLVHLYNHISITLSMYEASALKSGFMLGDSPISSPFNFLYGVFWKSLPLIR